MIFNFSKKNRAKPKQADTNNNLQLAMLLEDKIKFTHYLYGNKHHELFWETRAWYIDTLQREEPSDWQRILKDFDDELLKRKDNQADLIQYINETVLGYYIEMTAKGKTSNQWSKKETSEYTSFIQFLIDSSRKYQESGRVPPNLGGISHVDVPGWFKKWAKKEKLTIAGNYS